MGKGDDFLDSIGRAARPTPNVPGNFDCQTCYAPVDEAHYDGQAQLLRWWCENDHESRIEEIQL